MRTRNFVYRGQMHWQKQKARSFAVVGNSIMNNLGIGQEARTFSGSPATRGAVTKGLSGVLAILTLLTAAPGFAQLPYLEDFTTTTLRDGAATTADWAGTGKVLLPTAATLIDPFTATTTVEVLPGDAVNGHFITRNVELADLDNDGDLDLIEATSTTNGVYLNDGSGGFGIDRVYSSPTSMNTRDIVAGDVDRDGDVDFVTGNAFGFIKLYLNDGSGTSFDIQDVSSQGRETNSIALADLDGDGFLDVVAANLGFQQNIIYWNTGDPLTPFGPDGSSGTQLNSSFANESRRIVTGDLDNDGDIDLVFMNEQEQNPNDGNRAQRNRVYMNLGNTRTFSDSEIEVGGSDDIATSYGGALGDFDGDGLLDLVVVNFTLGEESRIYMNQGGAADSNPFTAPGLDFTAAGDPDFAQNAMLADADHDGDLDIYLVISGHDFRNRVYFNVGGAFSSINFVDVGPVGQAPLVLGNPADVGAVSNDGALGDVDGDGDLDWILGNQETQPSNGPMANILLRNTGTPDITTAQQLQARATSVTVDSFSGAASVSLNPLPQHTSLGPQFQTSIDYWVSGNGGTNWTPISADGRPVPIVPGNDVRWRADMRANSPANAATLAIDQLEIVENANAPVLDTAVAPDPLTVTEGVSVFSANITPIFSDADGDILYYSISGLPTDSGLRISTSSGQLVGSPNNEDTLAQPFTVVVTATDGAFSATDSYEIRVTNSNDAPDFTSLPPDLNVGPPATSGATQDVLYTYTVTATDIDPGDTTGLVISATQLPGWLSLSATANGVATLSGTPTAADVFDPNQTVALVVTDLGSATDTQTFAMAIANVDDDPVFTSTELTAATEGTEYSYTITVDDPDGDGVAITAPTLPAWLTLTDNGDGTATLVGTPVGADIGDHPVDIQAVDDSAAGLTANQVFSIAVTAAADAPVITLNGNASVTITEGNAYNDAGATATDAQDGDLTAAIVVDNPVNTGTPATYTVTYTVEDSAGNTATAQRTVVVSARPPPPPPARKSGGGSMGLVELLTFAMFGLLAFGLRRRRGMV
jgi:surface protein with Ig-like domain/VCBS repeat protein/putative Ig domain-containing protein